MFTFGNTFGKRTAKPVEHSQPDTTPSLEGAQLALDRASSAYQGKCDELEEAKNLLAGLEREAGRQDADNEDATATTQAIQAAAASVTRLDHSVAILAQRRDDAARSLEAAKQAAVAEAQEAARQALLELAEEGEELFIRIKLLRADVVRRGLAAREVGGIETWGERESLDYFTFFLHRANRSAAADAADSRENKYPSWTYCLRYACGKVRP